MLGIPEISERPWRFVYTFGPADLGLWRQLGAVPIETGLGRLLGGSGSSGGSLGRLGAILAAAWGGSGSSGGSMGRLGRLQLS